MNKFWLNVIGTVIAAAICANAACLYNFNARLAVIEQILKVKYEIIVNTR